jgi:hypothetical protein
MRWDRPARARGARRTGPADDVVRHGHRVREVDDHLADGRLGLDAEHPGEQRRPDRAALHEPPQIERLRLQRVEPSALVRRVQRRGQEPGRDEHEHDAGDLEELAQVDVDAAPVDPVSEDRGEEHAEHRAGAGEAGTGRLLERGEEEDRRLDSLAEDGEERHPDQRGGRALVERALGLRLQLAPQVRGVPFHPDDHPRDHPDGDEADDRLELLLLALGELLLEDAKRDADGRAQQHRGEHPQPHPAHRVTPAPLAEEGRDDPDDERRLQALPEADHERGEHRRLLPAVPLPDRR